MPLALLRGLTEKRIAVRNANGYPIIKLSKCSNPRKSRFGTYFLFQFINRSGPVLNPYKFLYIHPAPQHVDLHFQDINFFLLYKCHCQQLHITTYIYQWIYHLWKIEVRLDSLQLGSMLSFL